MGRFMTTVVVYEQGAASPMGLLGAAGAIQDLVVVLAPSEHAARLHPLFVESCVGVYSLTDPDLREQLAGHAPSGITTFSEPMLPATAQLAHDLGLDFHSLTVVERLTSKDAQRQRLRAAGVDATASVRISTVEQWEAAVREIGLPVVVKPVRGVNSRSTVLVTELAEGREQVTELLRAEAALVVEEYLAGVAVPEPFGAYLSVESVVQQGDRTHLAVTGKLRLAPPFRESGEFWPARLDRATREAVLVLTDQALKALEVNTGILHTEIKLTPAGPRIIEVNGRVGGYIPELARYAAGIDLIEVGLRIAGGERVPLEPEIDSAMAGRVCFSVTTPGPVQAGVVTEIPDAAALLALPGVTGYHHLARPGTAVGGFGTQDLDYLEGQVPDHPALAAVVEQVLDTVRYGFELGGQPVVRTARELLYTIDGVSSESSDRGRGE
jgi:biotin carboxylase